MYQKEGNSIHTAETTWCAGFRRASTGSNLSLIKLSHVTKEMDGWTGNSLIMWYRAQQTHAHTYGQRLPRLRRFVSSFPHKRFLFSPVWEFFRVGMSTIGIPSSSSLLGFIYTWNTKIVWTSFFGRASWIISKLRDVFMCQYWKFPADLLCPPIDSRSI